MKSLRCLVGLHEGHMVPANEMEQEVGRLSVFVCSRCGAVIE